MNDRDSVESFPGVYNFTSISRSISRSEVQEPKEYRSTIVNKSISETFSN
ncbi:hypothetical protein F9C07_2286811 [Aspergillus flavus]|uniref:Uncharacterized protein n=1 Tax=Aspergillus flavus (strain ATCC 200026 / FGSC A1120 / IAM 13836 / NRRL 3357 / JCM 12722 / SRRC 167) TaxID=332952 RepID=A0A7U2N487_ASPFN|nr:hypothetical protein F9C07_2286811 [Aspergillus flavus]